MTVVVPMSSATLVSLSERAAREGRDVAEVVADALGAAAAYARLIDTVRTQAVRRSTAGRVLLQLR